MTSALTHRDMPRANVAVTVAQTVQLMALMLVLAGFPLVAGFSELLGFISTPVSIAMRAITAMLCGVLFILSPRGMRPRLWWALALVTALFWLCYLLRMAHATAYDSYTLLYKPSSYWIWALGGSLVPLLGLGRAKFEHAAAHRLFGWAITLTAIAIIIALPNISTVIDNDAGGYDGGRAALLSLNPISLGHLGVQLVILCLWAMLLGTLPSNAILRMIYTLGVALGIYVAIAANSRGPLVSLIAVALFAVLASRVKGKYILVGALFVGVAAFVPLVALVDSIAGTAVYERLLGQSQFDDINVVIRMDLYSSAWAEFLKSPLTGSGLEDRAFGGYPHNLIIEAFMATGLIGGLLMLAIIALSLVCAFRIVRTMPSFAWLALLTVQQIVAAQFSGTISQATNLWGLIGALLAVSAVTSGATAYPAALRRVVRPRRSSHPERTGKPG